MGCATLAPTSQKPVPGSNRCPSTTAILPASAVSAKFGSRFAIATPICALAEAGSPPLDAHPDAAPPAAKGIRKHGRHQRAARFTERERRVLSFVFEGLANKQIADRLQISESAVKASLQQLFTKTGVRTRSQLVRIALEKYRDL